MGRYRKKPVEVEAVVWTGSNDEEIKKFAGDSAVFQDIVASIFDIEYNIVPCTRKLYFQTLEGLMEASVGDYIIKGVKGEVYACKPDVFKMTYEPVEEPVAPPCEPGDVVEDEYGNRGVVLYVSTEENIVDVMYNDGHVEWISVADAADYLQKFHHIPHVALLIDAITED